MPPSSETTGHPEFVRVVNASDAPFENWLNGKRVTMEPGESRVMTWDAAGGWLGDPTIFDSGRDRRRTQEYMRLRVMYGVYERQELNHLLPKLEVWWPVEADPAEQQRIHMILDDPDALRAPSFTAPRPATQEDRIAALERALAAERAARHQSADAEATDGGASASRNQKSKKPVADNTAGLEDLEPDTPVRPGVSA